MRALMLGLALVLPVACVTEPVEEPSFALQLSEGDFQVRRYPAMINAETTVRGDAWGARFAGFGPLADYIFATERGGEKIAMTAPVTQASRDKIAMTAPVTQAPRSKIAMTAPVTQSARSEDAASGEEWIITFTMPAAYTMGSLPAPVNPDVRLVEVPARTMGVLSFTGLATDGDMQTAESRLRQAVARAGLQAKGDVSFAFYDPPWVLPFFRRNEAMVEVEPRSQP
jgi:hypothetical protein